MRQLLLSWILVLAAAMLVVGRDRGVVVARNPGDTGPDERLDDLVRPRRIPHEVAKVVRGVHVPTRRDVAQHCLERRQIGVNVGDEGVAHRQPSSSAITVADAGHASRNSTDCLISSGTASRCVFTKPKLGKYRSAVVVSRYSALIPRDSASAITCATNRRPRPVPRHSGSTAAERSSAYSSQQSSRPTTPTIRLSCSLSATTKLVSASATPAVGNPLETSNRSIAGRSVPRAARSEASCASIVCAILSLLPS